MVLLICIKWMLLATGKGVVASMIPTLRREDVNGDDNGLGCWLVVPEKKKKKER